MVDNGDYSLSYNRNVINKDIKIFQGDVLEFKLNVSGHPFWIKTIKGKGQDNAVSSGISGIGQGQVSGVLVWNTAETKEGTYYYQCEYHAAMVGRILVKRGNLLHRI